MFVVNLCLLKSMARFVAFPPKLVVEPQDREAGDLSLRGFDQAELPLSAASFDVRYYT